MTTFAFDDAYAALINATAESFRRLGPHFTVSVTYAPPTEANIAVGYLQAYNPAKLNKVADQLFIMFYDMWHHHTVCAGPNSPLPTVISTIKTIIKLGASAEKMILGLPWVRADRENLLSLQCH